LLTAYRLRVYFFRQGPVQGCIGPLSLCQVPHQNSANCHIKNRPSATLKSVKNLTKRIMRSYARNQASQATAGTILADIKANGDEKMSENTVYD
jgi:hypothetical protein